MGEQEVNDPRTAAARREAAEALHDASWEWDSQFEFPEDFKVAWAAMLAAQAQPEG